MQFAFWITWALYGAMVLFMSKLIQIIVWSDNPVFLKTLAVFVMVILSLTALFCVMTLDFPSKVLMPESVLIVRMVMPNSPKLVDTLDVLYIERPYLMSSRVSPGMAERLLMQLPAGEILIVFPDKDGWRIRARCPDITGCRPVSFKLIRDGWTVGDQLSPK